MIFLRKSGMIALGIAFVLVIFCCAFCQPFRPGRVCDAIPRQATFVFKADNLDALLKSPVCDQLDGALGAGNRLEDLLADNEWADWAAASEIAVADIPFRSSGRHKSWAAATWVGWQSPWLRWKLEQCRDQRLSLLGKHNVWPVWQFNDPEIANGMSLTFSLTDDLFIICLSETPTDILLLLETYDQRAPAHQQTTENSP